MHGKFVKEKSSSISTFDALPKDIFAMRKREGKSDFVQLNDMGSILTFHFCTEGQQSTKYTYFKGTFCRIRDKLANTKGRKKSLNY